MILRRKGPYTFKQIFCFGLASGCFAQMPEIAELHLFANAVNSFVAGKKWGGIFYVCKDAKSTPHFQPPFAPFSLSAQARGKEIKLTATSLDGGQKFEMTFFHGLIGGWVMSSSQGSKQTGSGKRQMFFQGTQPSEQLGFCGFSPYWRIGSWGDNRGPDPYSEHNAFRHSLFQNLNKKSLNAPLHEAMLDQQYFSGIGNYLRAEILYRAKVDPFQNTSDLFRDKPKEAESLMDVCYQTIQEVVNLNLNKYGSSEEQERFRQWLQCYEKPTAKCVVDRQKRKFYYDPSQYSPGSKGSVAKQTSGKKITQATTTQTQVSPPTLAFLETRSQPISLLFPIDLVEPGETERSPATKLMVLVHHLHRTGLLKTEQKRIIKSVVFSPFDPNGKKTKKEEFREMLLGTVQAFAAEGSFDYADASDTLTRLIRWYQMK